MRVGIHRLNGDSWVALGLIAANTVFLIDLTQTDSDGAYVKATTLPFALSATLVGFSLLLLGWSLLRPAGPRADAQGGTEAPGGNAPLVRVFAAIILTIAFVAALPWFGYLLSSAAYLGGLSLLYGNRSPLPILALMVGLPLALMLFFEKYMIVLLPSARIFE